MKSIKFIAYIFFGLLFFACEEIPPEIPPFQVPDSDKVVLLEELTGVRCPNCPEGQAIVEELLSKYPKNLVSVAIHTEFLGDPWPDSKYNFITDEGETIEDEIGLYFGKPSVTINRKLFDGEQLKWMTLQRPWESYIQQELQSFADFHVNIHNKYNSTERVLNTDIEIEAQLDISGQFFINVMVLESGIIDVQEGSDGIEPEYEHNHVLRTMLTPALGESISSSYKTLEIESKSYEFNLPEEDGSWKAENMAILAFVTQYDSDCDCQIVLQAGESKFIE